MKMKKIFIYYSLSGNGDYIANYLSQKNIDIRKVIPKKALPKNTFLRILIGGFLAGIKHRDILINFDNDISQYDEIIIGSPIWNNRLSCPINAVLDTLPLTNKKITFILYSGSGNATKMAQLLKEKYENINIISIKEPKTNLTSQKMLKELI